MRRGSESTSACGGFSARSRRRTAASSVILTAALCGVLTACSSSAGSDELPEMPFDTVAMPPETAAVATPGQHLQPGDIALLAETTSSGQPGEQIETTVIGVAEGDGSYWDRFDNGEEFADETPFFAVMQYRWVTGEVNAYGIPALQPILDDGSTGDTLQRQYFGSLNADTACPFEVPRFDLDATRGPEEYIACVVYAAPIGSTLAGLAWAGAETAGSDPALNPYAETPVVWDVVPVPLSSGDEGAA